MSTASISRPLAPVAPMAEQKARMAWLLGARQEARQALDAALRVPHRAAAFVVRLLAQTRVGRFVAAALRPITPAVALLRRARQQLGGGGVLAVATAMVTSGTGAALLRRTAALVGRAVRRGALATLTAGDAGLRLFGEPGRRAGDALALRCARLAARVTDGVAQLRQRTQALVAGVRTASRGANVVARAYLTHLIAVAITPGVWARLVVEATVLPLLAARRLRRAARDTIATLVRRAALLRAQRRAPGLVVIDAPLAAAAEPAAPSAASPAAPQGDNGALEVPLPANRVERRALQREGRRQHHPVQS